MHVLLNNISETSLIIIAITLIVGVIIIALNGKLSVKFGKRLITIGRGNRIRSCSDCVMMIMTEGSKCRTTLDRLESSILKRQMVYTERKLPEISEFIVNRLLTLNSEFNKDLYKKLVYEMINSSLYTAVKDEFRRSFKENGFSELKGSRFNDYVNEQSNNLKEIICKYLRFIYTDSKELNDVISAIKRTDNLLNGHIYDVYDQTKNIKIELDAEIRMEEQRFTHYIDKLVESNIS